MAMAELIATIRFEFAIPSCLSTMKLSTMALSAHTPSHPPKAAEVSRNRSTQSNIVPAPRQGAGHASSSSLNLNKVLFTIPWSVQFGESLSVSGEGSELGSWNPEESLPLKWNEGDLWAAEVSLPTGDKREYKYVVKDPSGCLKAWQPGENCAVEVPAEVDASLQVADDWHGKSRSVIYKDGQVQTAPAGTFDGPPAQASAAAAVPISITQSNTMERNQVSASADSTTGASSTLPHAAATQPDAQANGSAPADMHVAQVAEPHDKGVDDETGIPLEELPVKTLQKRLRSRKQKVSGKKADLIDRLQSIDP